MGGRGHAAESSERDHVIAGEVSGHGCTGEQQAADHSGARPVRGVLDGLGATTHSEPPERRFVACGGRPGVDEDQSPP